MSAPLRRRSTNSPMRSSGYVPSASTITMYRPRALARPARYALPYPRRPSVTTVAPASRARAAESSSEALSTTMTSPSRPAARRPAWASATTDAMPAASLRHGISTNRCMCADEAVAAGSRRHCRSERKPVATINTKYPSPIRIKATDIVTSAAPIIGLPVGAERDGGTPSRRRSARSPARPRTGSECL